MNFYRFKIESEILLKGKTKIYRQLIKNILLKKIFKKLKFFNKFKKKIKF